jgi:NAD(P)H-flavin reductase
MTCTLHADPWQVQTATIREIIPELDDIATYRLETPPGSSYAFQPGQFNMLYLPGVGESAISMSGDPHARDSWIHTVRVAGNVTRTLAAMRVGDTLGLRGPFGAGWPVDEWRGKDVILVAGGVGLAPLRPVIYDILHRRPEFGHVTVILGARTPGGLLYPSEQAAWKRGGIDVQQTVDRAVGDWTGNVGVVTLLLDRLRLLAPENTCVATCGPEVMMRFTALSAARRGIPAERVWVSLERNMQCAAGLCGHCQLAEEFVCKDGPVFRYDRVARLMTVEGL